MSRSTIYTVGYSTHEWPDFLRLLRAAGITALADVRSNPQARLPQYRQENLAPALRAEGIAYVWLGKELGARRDEPECYVEGRADYELVAQLPAFREGITRLERGASDHAIALMCAEREPLDCHRGLLIARVLTNEGWRVRHLLADGAIEEHSDTERRLVERVGVDPLLDAGADFTTLVDRAYRELGGALSYEPPSQDSGR
ncbi:hypothetical protein Pla108_01090 [Botrimarina colliarenosi]|uniref:DUF488 domain-containing protein n=1 Tax=Botrimarina colliarenosi TaxID=2528001 RepID=A0A5C6AJ24_9BACT|nr:DUF488 domain-containing protein [Botrimarina colliarenosi]TWT99175.1 hypothetical protein Pla108_01090 [Botrimarina colliarenosi]